MSLAREDNSPSATEQLNAFRVPKVSNIKSHSVEFILSKETAIGLSASANGVTAASLILVFSFFLKVR